MGERRHNKNRFDIGNDLTVRLGDEHSPARVVNVSFGGVLLETELRPKINSEVELSSDDQAAVSGMVVRHVDNGFAVDLGLSAESATFAVESITSGMILADQEEPDFTSTIQEESSAEDGTK